MMEPHSIRLHYCLAVAWRVVRRSARRAVVPDIVAVAWAAICGAPGRHHIKPGPTRAAARGLCVNQNIRTQSLNPDFMRSYCVRNDMCETRIK